MKWTEERVGRLKDLWAEGYSATRIAGMMGDLTRNAVLGKVHRLGLPERKVSKKIGWAINGGRSVAANGNRGAVTRSPRKPRLCFGVSRPELKVITNPTPPAPPPDASIWEADPGKAAVLLMEVAEDMCRWPLGDPKAKDFGFCGCPKEPGYSFCTRHAKLAYQRVRRRKT